MVKRNFKIITSSSKIFQHLLELSVILISVHVLLSLTRRAYAVTGRASMEEYAYNFPFDAPAADAPAAAAAPNDEEPALHGGPAAAVIDVADAAVGHAPVPAAPEDVSAATHISISSSSSDSDSDDSSAVPEDLIFNTQVLNY